MLSFKQQLKRQLDFLERSSFLFDQGYQDESIRIATTIRVLLHDTKNSTSLLTHLNAKDIKICSTIGKTDDDCFFMIGGLYSMGIVPGTGHRKVERSNEDKKNWFTILNSGTPHHIPSCYLDKNEKYETVSIETWINQTVLVTSIKASRKDIYLGAANTDGGAHVDSKLKYKYDRLSYGGALGYTQKKINGQIKDVPIENVQLAILRQMAHELLVSEELLNLLK